MLKFYIVFLAIILTTLGGILLISKKLYPVAMVNTQIITAAELETAYRTGALYFENVRNMYAQNTPEDEETLSPIYFQAAALTSLIEDRLIKDAAEKELGAELEGVVLRRVQAFDADTEFRVAAQALYGIEFENIKTLVLVPQARRDLLQERLVEQNQTIEEWLQEKKFSSNVYLFLRKFEWDGQKVHPVYNNN